MDSLGLKHLFIENISFSCSTIGNNCIKLLRSFSAVSKWRRPATAPLFNLFDNFADIAAHIEVIQLKSCQVFRKFVWVYNTQPKGRKVNQWLSSSDKLTNYLFMVGAPLLDFLKRWISKETLLGDLFSFFFFGDPLRWLWGLVIKFNRFQSINWGFSGSGSIFWRRIIFMILVGVLEDWLRFLTGDPERFSLGEDLGGFLQGSFKVPSRFPQDSWEFPSNQSGDFWRRFVMHWTFLSFHKFLIGGLHIIND